MKVTRKKIIPIVAVGVLVLTAFVVFMSLRPKTIVVAFRDIPEKSQNAITKAIEQYLANQKISLKVVTLDNLLPVEQQLSQKPRPDLLISYAGKATDNAVRLSESREAGISLECLKDMPNSIKESAIVNNDYTFAVPVLMDHYELALSKNPNGQYPFLFNGNDNHTLLTLAGSIAESNFGGEAAMQLAQDCASSDLATIPMMQDIAEIIGNTIISGKMPLSMLDLKGNEISIYMLNIVPDSVFMSLSFHRTLPFDAVKKYDATFFPAGHRNRMLIAPIVYGVPLSSKERINTILNGILCHLTSYDSQTFLAKEAGLAPVHANAPTPDIQGNDVRYWVAATNRPLAALADAAFETDAELNKAAETFRTMILEYVYTNTR